MPHIQKDFLLEEVHNFRQRRLSSFDSHPTLELFADVLEFALSELKVIFGIYEVFETADVVLSPQGFVFEEVLS